MAEQETAEKAESDSKAETESTTTHDPKETKTDERLGDAGKKALETEREARKVAEAEAKRLQKLIDDADAAKAKAIEEEAAKKGEWETLATKREGERDAARTEAATLTAQLDQYRAAVQAVIDAEWKQLPKEVAEVFSGAEDDLLGRLAWLPKGKALAEKLAGGANAARGNGVDPKAKGAAGNRNEDAAKATAARYKSNF